MMEYHYIIVGGGMTAAAAAESIRSIDSTNNIGIISEENHPPYNRPPLSKGLWKGKGSDTLYRSIPQQGVELHLARTIVGLDKDKKLLHDNEGTTYSFQKLLLATGGEVRRLPFAVDGIIYFRTLNDYEMLREMTGRCHRFAVIGGGFIGSEIAAALAMNDKSVTLIFPEDGIGSRVYPPSLSRFLNHFYHSKGITVLHNTTVTNITKSSSSFVVSTSSGNALTFDGVVAGIGITPRTDLAASAGLAVNNGIIVDEYLRTGHPDIFAAGDVANYFSPVLGKRLRSEHEDNAITMGDIAGRNMAGTSTPYHHLPFFYSDLFELGYEAVGDLDMRLEMIEDWKEPFHEGVVYYLNEKRVRGVLLWNTWGQVDSARALLAEPGPFDSQNLIGRLPR